MPNVIQSSISSAYLVEGQSQEVYSEQHEFIRSSALKQILITPWHFQHYLQHPKTETKAMTKGTALHAALLEPENFQRQFVVVPKIDRRGKEGKARWKAFTEANIGKVIIQSHDVELIKTLRRSIAANPKARALLTLPGKPEVSLYWTDPQTGIRLKARTDRLLVQPQPLLLEVKSTTKAGKGYFQKKIVEFDYHFSVAMYREGLKCIFGECPPAVFLVIEDETFQICLYTPDQRMLNDGYKRFRHAVELLAECREANRWPGYQPDSMIEEISLPRWATKSINASSA